MHIDDPTDYDNLSEKKRAILREWIAENVAPNVTAAYSSYSLKSCFQKSSNGFYVTNGQFKGAMAEAGYKSTDISGVNWLYRVSLRR